MAGYTGQRHIAILMTHRSLRGVAAIAVLATTPACLDVANPVFQQPDIEVSLDFCADETPIWIAYQDEDGWVRLTPDASGTVTFSAPYPVALAMVHVNGADTRGELILTTNTVLDKVSGQQCLEETGTKTLNGSTAGVQSEQLALITAGFASLYRTSAQNTFTLSNVATRPLDIIASRMNIVGTTEQHANRTIIRRSQNLVSGATIPLFDFEASEAILPTSATAVVSGLSASDQAFITNNFFSQLGTSHLMTYKEGITNGNVELDAIPGGNQATGDYHDVFITVTTTSQGVRGVERFFRVPGSHTLQVGPSLTSTNISTEGTTPYLRLRSRLPTQAEYPSASSVEFFQQSQFAATRWTITATAGVFAGVLAPFWDLQLPDFSGAPGWQNAWGLQPNVEYSWTTTSYGVRAELLFGAAPNDGELTQYALRMSEPVGARRSGPVRPVRPHQFGRRR